MTSTVLAPAPAHAGGGAASAGALLPLLLLGTAATGYLLLATRESRRRGWSWWRAGLFTAGTVLMGWALSPGFDALADADFGVHMAQHLLVAMLAPLALVLGAPVTLLLRSLPPARARLLGRALRSRPLHVLANPFTALLLSAGGLVALYLTPLYAATTSSDAVHALVHLHLAASGYLFAWVIAGPDPAPRRPSVRTRLLVLGAAVAVHATVAQLLFAGLLVQVHEPVAQMQAARQPHVLRRGRRRAAPGGGAAADLATVAVGTARHRWASDPGVVSSRLGQADRSPVSSAMTVGRSVLASRL